MVADDQVEIGTDGMARPPEALAGLLEVRGLGVMRFPVPRRRDARFLWPNWSPGRPRGCPSRSRTAVLRLPAIAIDPRPASAAQLLALAFDCVLGRAIQRAGAFT